MVHVVTKHGPLFPRNRAVVRWKLHLNPQTVCVVAAVLISGCAKGGSATSVVVIIWDGEQLYPEPPKTNNCNTMGL